MAENDNVTLEFLRRQLAEAQASPLKSGGGGGTFDDMESRVKRLEEDSKEMRSDLKTIVRELAEMKGILSGLPKTWQVFQINLGVMTVSIAIVGITMAVLHGLGKI
jgi:hypothetical protein